MLKNENKLIEAAKNREWCYLETIDADMPTWNEVFFAIEELRPTDNWLKKPNLNFHILDSIKIKKVAIIKRYFQEIFYKNVVTAHTYFGICEQGSESLNLHKDSMDVIYIQAINRTRFNVRDGTSKQKNKILFDKVFEPQEIIYVPAGTAHEIISFEPRASISIGVEGIMENYPPDYL